MLLENLIDGQKSVRIRVHDVDEIFTKAALELRDGAELAIRFERDLHVSAISQGERYANAPDGSNRDLGLTTYGDSPLLSPGTVVAAKIARPLDSKIHIHTEIAHQMTLIV